MALERFRQAYDRWPQTLDELCPKFLASVLEDPCTGQPLQYRFTKDGVVVYKLTSGQPVIHEIAENQDVLGPLQTLSAKLKLDFNSISSPNAPSQPTVSEPVTALRRK